MVQTKGDMMLSYWFVFHQSDLLLQRDDGGNYNIPYSEFPPFFPVEKSEIRRVSIPSLQADAQTFSIDNIPELPDEFMWMGLRDAFKYLSAQLYQAAGKCSEIIYWHKHTKFCGVCGTKMEFATEISKKCPNCGGEIWPQLSPAVIVLIRKDDKLLLVRAHNFKRHFFGLVAGFVETGETLEEAVQREVFEETQLKIKNLKYFGSQPWPYPCGLMVGFMADYKAGHLVLQQSELADGGWFSKDNLPPIPEKLSIARKLIDAWINEGA